MKRKLAKKSSDRIEARPERRLGSRDSRWAEELGSWQLSPKTSVFSGQVIHFSPLGGQITAMQKTT